ncbi:MBL fold metallo-hydrolase [Methanomassiliicoccus luminyensis]|uniref:MBL fold metallo-hydrolase n=1 Tax=Methanomassiliicoccus luminyensis TaxID=1080712 RepID=UPI00038250C3|nr:MBL fold metallo-hydrolase [Methanomassiliicoccus luminyensis]
MTSVTFLGTGGGRFATIYQVRATGGLYINDGVRLHLDPGPSALMNMRRLALDPAKTNAVLISHCHPDHYADAEMLVEGMTKGGFKHTGTLVGSRSAMEGTDGFSPAVSAYHQSIVGRAIVAEANSTFTVGDMRIDATPTSHGDPTGVGFRFHCSAGNISYVSDTELGPGIAEAHRGSRVLILNVTRPLNSRVPKHLCTEEAATLAKEVGPEVVVLTHFGMKLVHDGVNKQARYIERSSGAKVIAAEDLMTVQVGKTVRATRSRGQELVEGGRERLDLDK